MFDANIAIIGNFVLIAKTRVKAKFLNELLTFVLRLFLSLMWNKRLNWALYLF